MFEEADLIHAYPRADALRDGELIDVSAPAREAGIRWPVALTRAAWVRCVTVPPGVACQDEAGRLWDVLWLPRVAIGRGGGGPGSPRWRPRPQRQPGANPALGAAQGGLRARGPGRAGGNGHAAGGGLRKTRDGQEGNGPPAAPFQAPPGARLFCFGRPGSRDPRLSSRADGVNVEL
jgi:hypothetical protein